jgi:hypothetical protein
MSGRRPHIWKLLPFIALGLMLVGDFAPISDSLGRSLFGAAIAVLLVFSAAYFWQERRARQANQSSSAAISSNDQM